MPLYRPTGTSAFQNLLTSDGLNVMGLLDGQPLAIAIRVVIDRNTEPGAAIVSLEALVPGMGWRSAGFGRHAQ